MYCSVTIRCFLKFYTVLLYLHNIINCFNQKALSSRLVNFYTPRNEVRGGGYTGITLSVCLSVCSSVCRHARLGRIARLGKMVSDTLLGESELVAAGGILSR